MFVIFMSWISKVQISYFTTTTDYLYLYLKLRLTKYTWCYVLFVMSYPHLSFETLCYACFALTNLCLCLCLNTALCLFCIYTVLNVYVNGLYICLQCLCFKTAPSMLWLSRWTSLRRQNGGKSASAFVCVSVCPCVFPCSGFHVYLDQLFYYRD